MSPRRLDREPEKLQRFRAGTRVDTENFDFYTRRSTLGRHMFMRLKKSGWSIGAALSVLCMLGVADAQTDDAPAGSAPPPPEVGAGQNVNLTPAQQVAEADKYIAEMERSASTVRKQLAAARKERDVVKVLCLNDKLNQMEVAVRSAGDRRPTLKNAADAGKAETAKHEFVVIQVLRDRVRSLVAEANQCIGEETGFVGESDVTVDIDPSIPDTDPSVFPDDPLISDPPFLASPTL